MAKGNLFMGNASGKLADVVLYRNAGTQVSRLRVRKPANPRTEQQKIQRVIQSTNSKAYSVLRALCDHAFEGKASKIENQSEFMKLNVARDRYRVNVAPMGYRALSNFNSRTRVAPLANNYIVAMGSLPEMAFSGDGSFFSIAASLGDAPTYQNVVDALGLQKGDQLTFMNVVVADDGAMSSMHLARVIFEPSDGDMSTVFIASGAVNKPNEKNEGQLTVAVGDGSISFEMAEAGGAQAIIVSRFDEGKWLRSPSRMFVAQRIDNPPTLGEAIDSWTETVSSAKYLNQAQNLGRR